MTPFGEKLEIITEDDVQETKPVTVPNQVQDDNKAEGGKVSVELETLTLRPVWPCKAGQTFLLAGHIA